MRKANIIICIIKMNIQRLREIKQLGQDHTQKYELRLKCLPLLHHIAPWLVGLEEHLEKWGD